MLKLMYITNRTDIALIAENAGVERIFIDMEYIGKAERQGGMDTVQSRHTIEDIRAIRSVLTSSQLLVRCNPIHERCEKYSSSKVEIDGIIDAGADVVMLPFFKTVEEVETFVKLVNRRAKTMLLFETPESVELVDEILSIGGIDEVFIGLNDLSLGYEKKFMFELLSDGTVEKLCDKFKYKNIPYGFGGIAALGKGMLPSEYVIKEHYRLNSTCAILSRSFCNVDKVRDVEKVKEIFDNDLKIIRDLEKQCSAGKFDFEKNKLETKKLVEDIVKNLTK